MKYNTAIFCFLFISFSMINSSEIGYARPEYDSVILRALSFECQDVNNEVIPEVADIKKESRSYFSTAEYEKGLELVLDGLEKYPNNFALQSDFAALIGDLSERALTNDLSERMIGKSKQLFERLLLESEYQEKNIFYPFKNEYYFRFRLHKEQYESGCDTVRDAINDKELTTRGFYFQGAGAVYYAKQLIEKNETEEALEYATQSVISWSQYFMYRNDYYNSYVHYALALGILGDTDKMMRALQRGADLINEDMNYHEFKDVIDFINDINKQ